MAQKYVFILISFYRNIVRQNVEGCNGFEDKIWMMCNRNSESFLGVGTAMLKMLKISLILDTF